MAYFYRHLYNHNHVISASPFLSFSTLLLLLLVPCYTAEIYVTPGIEISNLDGGDVISVTVKVPETTNIPPVYCACEPSPKRTSGNCSQPGTCPSLTGCCRVNIWYHHNFQNFSIDLPGCSVSAAKDVISHDTMGGHEGDAIFIVSCCGTSGCNNWTNSELHNVLVPQLCNYTEHVKESIYDVNDPLAHFRKYCQSLNPVKIGPFTVLEFTLLLVIPLGISICILCVVFVYTRRVNHCSAKQFLIRLFAGPKCWCVRYNKHRENRNDGRCRSRNSDTSAQQPLFEVATYNHTRCDNNSSNISTVTDSGFSNGFTQGRNKKMSQDSQGTQTSSLVNSGVGGHRPLTSSLSSGSGTNVLPATTVLSTRLLQPQTDLNCDTIGEVTNSGSGAGIPSLGRRTMAYQIQLHEVIGRGRYGVVHRGVMFCDSVAVKIFQSRDERAWLRERQIYTTQGMQHDQILAFRGADSKDTGLTTELWLVTEYHPNGSLFDFLSQRTVNLRNALKLAYSLVCGLAHLHLEISGTPGKPAIAHRDIKSRNILIKANNTCCIADFGFAVTYSSASDTLEQSPASFQCCVGTRRYMSNEILDKTLDCNSFTSFTAADLYALGLILWEILRRTELNDQKTVDEAELPFMEFGVGPDPSQNDMYQIVCVEKKRPTIPSRFRSNVDAQILTSDTTSVEKNEIQHIASSLGQLVDELWQETPSARPTALQVKKILLRVMKNKE